MKEISYDGIIRREVVVEETYRGHKYVIIDNGSWPTAYVAVNSISLDKAAEIRVHGGVTWKGEAHWENNPYTLYIGWDYAHLSDCVVHSGDTSLSRLDGDKHTTEEIIVECKFAIDQLILLGDEE